jgi:hypothetical protein
MTQDTYWSDYDIEQTLARLASQNEKNMVQVDVARAGRTQYTVTVTCNDNGRAGRLTGTLDVLADERVRLNVQAYRQRNRQLAMVLIPVVLGVGAWVASATGSVMPLVVIPVVLVVGTSALQRLARPREMALGLLLEALREPQAATAPKRRRRMKKRQWGAKSQ